MADLRPEKPVEEHFSLNKRGKYLYGAGAVAIAGLLLAIFWLKDRKSEENVTDNVAKQASGADSSGGAQQTAKVQTDLRRGVDANADPAQAEAQFVDIVKQRDAEKAKQDEAARLVNEKSRQDEVAKARQEGRQQAQAQNGGYPATVGQNGLAADGRVLTPEEAAAQQQTRQAQALVPPEAVVDPSQWSVSAYGRVRPAYQTNSKYPLDQKGHDELDKLHFNGFFSPMVVGVGDRANAAMSRFEQDTRGVEGGFGQKRTNQRLNLKANANLPPKPPPPGDAWGGWIRVEAVPSTPGGSR